MIKDIFYKIFNSAAAKQESDFSSFFLNASSGEKKKLLKEVVREANSDQKKLVDNYRKIYSNGSN